MLTKRVKYLFSVNNLKEWGKHFLMILGILWLLIEFISFFFSDLFTKDVWSFWIALLLSIAWATYQSLPPTSYSLKSKASSVEIKIKAGNILEEKCHIVIGSGNKFISGIHRNSLKAKFIKRFFGDDYDRFNEKALMSLQSQGLIDHSFNNETGFPIGTVAIVDFENKKLFLPAIAKFGPEQIYKTSKEDLWTGLCGLWDTIVRCSPSAPATPIAIPMIGSGPARFPASRILIAQLIFISFAMATREHKVTHKLILVINEEDYDAEEMVEIIQILKTIRF